jgi:hypothetical protein
MKRLLVAVVVYLPLMAGASTAPYLPLQVGNRWDYVEAYWGYSIETASGALYLDTGKGIVLNLDTLEQVPDSLVAALPPPQSGFELVRRRGTEYSLSVDRWVEMGGHRYYQMSTGQLLRNDVEGCLIEYPMPDGPERVIFDFPSALANPGDMRTFGVLLPFGIPWFGWPGHTYPHTRETSIGLLSGVMCFTYSDGHDSWGLCFAPDVGVIQVGGGNDTSSYATILSGGIVDGRTLGTTNVRPASWARLKREHRRQ